MGIASAAKSFLSSIVAKLQKWMAILALVLPAFLLIEVIIALAVSPGKSCVESYQFDSESRFIDAKPVSDGIFGGPYSNSSGGEIAGWHPTGIRTNGGPLTFEIRGAWTAWDDATNNDQLSALKECTICAKKAGVSNCICADDQTPSPELDYQGHPIAVDCSDIAKQEDPAKCTCTKQHGSVSDMGTYFIATDYQNKDESLKLPDDQEPCRYTRGEGLYVGLFGKDGNSMPKRAYQLYPTREVCDINRNAQGKCVDDSNKDQTKYLYTSPNGKIFIKDDKNGNGSIDPNPDDDEYHVAGEFIKMIIYDRYYHDNFGGYDIEFMGGFLRDGDNGLLEYVVGTVEDVVLGKIDSSGKRQGGVMQFMYNSIVMDSAFVRIVQMGLIIYITIFGIYVLSGSVQLSRKEVLRRVIKVALIMFFTTSTSWYFYDQLVVGMFKRGMDSVISIFMDISDQSLDSSSLIVASQLDRANDVSNSTRFSYIDSIIKKLFSEPSTKKIWGLFFGEWFGMALIPLIYALIGYFIFTMLTAAFVYIQSFLKLMMVLALGPIFIITSFYDKTDEIFKRWISFMGARAMEIIVLFLVLYLFIILIDKNFTDMLSVNTCPVIVNFGLFNIGFMKTDSDRGLVGWIIIIFETGALLWLLNMIIKQIPGFAGQLVIINKQKADISGSYVKDTNDSSFKLAGDMMGMLTKAGTTALNRGLPTLAHAGLTGANFIGKRTGLNNAANKLFSKIPKAFNPRRIVREARVDDVIAKHLKAGKKDGKTGADLDKYVRDAVKKDIDAQNKLDVKGQSWKGKDDPLQPTDKMLQAVSDKTLTSRFLGIDDDVVNKRLDKALIEDTLKDTIKSEIDKMKKSGEPMPLGREEMRKAMAEKISAWAKSEGYSDEKTKGFLSLLEEQKYSSMVKKHGELSSSEAAKVFAGNETEKQRYLDHLQNRQYEKELKRQDASGTIFKNLKNAAKDVGRTLQRDTAYNPKMARENFLRKIGYEEARRENQKNYGLFKKLLDKKVNLEKTSITQRINALDRFNRRDEIDKMSSNAQKQSLFNYVQTGHRRSLDAINKKYNGQLAAFDAKAKADPALANYADRRKIEAQRDEELKAALQKNQDYRAKLADHIKNENEELKQKVEVADKDNAKMAQDELKMNNYMMNISQKMEASDFLRDEGNIKKIAKINSEYQAAYQAIVDEAKAKGMRVAAFGGEEILKLQQERAKQLKPFDEAREKLANSIEQEHIYLKDAIENAGSDQEKQKAQAAYDNAFKDNMDEMVGVLSAKQKANNEAFGKAAVADESTTATATAAATTAPATESAPGQEGKVLSAEEKDQAVKSIIDTMKNPAAQDDHKALESAAKLYEGDKYAAAGRKRGLEIKKGAAEAKIKALGKPKNHQEELELEVLEKEVKELEFGIAEAERDEHHAQNMMNTIKGT